MSFKEELFLGISVLVSAAWAIFILVTGKINDYPPLFNALAIIGAGTAAFVALLYADSRIMDLLKKRRGENGRKKRP